MPENTERSLKSEFPIFLKLFFSAVPRLLTPSIEKGAKVAHTITSKLVSQKGDKNLILCEIVDCSGTGSFLGSAQLTI